MIEIKKHNSKLVAIYSPESGTYWLQDKVNKGENHYLKNTYRLSKDKILDLHEIDEDLADVEDFVYEEYDEDEDDDYDFGDDDLLGKKK